MMTFFTPLLIQAKIDLAYFSHDPAHLYIHSLLQYAPKDSNGNITNNLAVWVLELGGAGFVQLRFSSYLRLTI